MTEVQLAIVASAKNREHLKLQQTELVDHSRLYVYIVICLINSNN